MNWDQKFIGLANHIATWSKDRSRQVGCVVVNRDNAVLSIGYNGFARGAKDDIEERQSNRELKYCYTIHAEANAVANAAQNGASLWGSRLYVNWFPCRDCAKLIIQSRISEVIAPPGDFDHERWGENFRMSKEMLFECGVRVRAI